MREKWAWAQRAWTKATNDTGSGDPKLSTPEKGEAYFNAIAGKIAGHLVELAAADHSDKQGSAGVVIVGQGALNEADGEAVLSQAMKAAAAAGAKLLVLHTAAARSR